MMLPTHAVAGMVVALPYAIAVPEFGGVALVAGFLGGLLPDLDMYVGHRKTLHFPVYYPALALAVAPVALLVPTGTTVLVAFVLLGAAVHSVTDVLGGGLELRPWEATSDRAVYDHYRGRWIAPRRWIRYDGAPEDLLLAVALAVPLLVAVDGLLELAVLSSLAVGVVYTAVRRSLPALAVRLVEDVIVPSGPNRVFARVPARYLRDVAEGAVTAADREPAADGETTADRRTTTVTDP